MNANMMASTIDNIVQGESENLVVNPLCPINYNQYFVVIVFTIVLLLTLCQEALKDTHKLSQKTSDYFKELPSLPLIGVGLQAYLYRNDFANLAMRWRKRYGPCLRTRVLGKDILLIHDPELLKSLLLSNDVGHLDKPHFLYQNLIVGTANNGLLSMPAKDWPSHRKTLSPLFTHQYLKSYIEIYHRYGEKLAKDLENDGHNENPSYRQLVHLRTLDIITEITVGVPFESVLGKEGTLKFYHDLESIIRITADKIFYKVWKMIPILWYFDPQRKELEKCIQDFEGAVQKVRESHVTQENSNFALDIMMKANWSNQEILAELLTLIVGGHDTVSSNFVLHLWLLALEQEHQIACQREVDELFDRLEESGEELTLNSLTELKYLERCVKESLRIFPSTSVGTTREIKTPHKLNDDVTLVPGNIVTYIPYVLHRDPNVFPDPEKFDPDRFLPENVKNRSPYTYLPFSAGPRNCLGWKAALLELTVLSAVLLRHFHLTTTDTRDDIKVQFKFTLHTPKEPNVKFTRRR